MPKQSSTAPAPRQTLPPDPYADDPYSPMFVLFRPIPGLHGYGVDTDGNVWSCRERRAVPGKKGASVSAIRGRWVRLKARLLRRVYLGAELVAPGGRRTSYLVHCLVLTTFIGPRPDGFQGCHINGRPDDARLANLRWGTPESNYADRDRHGTTAVGERNGLSKLTASDVVEMRRLHDAGWGYKRLSQRFDVGPATARRVIKGETWRHVERVPGEAGSRLTGGEVIAC